MSVQKELVLTLSECKEIIKNYLKCDDFGIINYKVEPFSDSVNGFMSEHLLIVISFTTKDGQKEKSFFAKRFPYQHELHSIYANAVGAFPNETFTYQVMFNKFKKCPGFNPNFTPILHFCKDDLLVFEDLREQQFVMHETPNALPIDHIEPCLLLLAKYHAGSIGYQEMKSKELGKRYWLNDEYQKYMQEPLFQKDDNFLGYHWFKARLSALNAIVDLVPFADISSEELKQKIKEVGERSFEIMKPKDTFYNVLCHGDMWAKNFMFRYQNGSLVETKIIDFQLQHYCPPAHDVLQLLFLAMDSKRRQRHLHSLLKYYYGCLRQELEKSELNINKIISYADFEASINYLLPQIKLQTAYYYGFQATEPEFHRKLKGNVNDFKKFVFGDGAPFATELFKTDSNYKKLQIEAITELKILVDNDIVSLEDCYKIVEQKIGTTDYDIIDYFVQRVNGISGFLGDHYRLTINTLVPNKKTLKFFVKCAPKSKTRFDLAVGAKVFVKEGFVLETLLPMIQQVGIKDICECIVPHYVIRVNDIIVFDDLTHDGFQPASQRVPFNFDELQVVVRKLAIYHASNIVLEEKLTDLKKTPFRLSFFHDKLEESFFPTENHNYSSLSIKLGVETVPFQLELFSELNFSEDLKSNIQKAFEVCYQLVKPSNDYRNVVCHGDLWADNIMMKYDKRNAVDCRIIDYQILRYCPPAHDLLTLLHLTTTRSVRSECMDMLIDYYYNIFSNTLSRHHCDVDSIYSYEHFLASCKTFVPQAVCQTVLFYHFTMTSPELMKDYIQDEELTNKIFLIDRKDFIKDMCDKDSVYKTRMKESLEDLREMCLKYF